MTFGGGATDESLAACRKLPKVQEVTLSVCEDVTDQGLTQLYDLPELKQVHVFFTKRVTERGVTALKTARPDIDVSHINTW